MGSVVRLAVLMALVMGLAVGLRPVQAQEGLRVIAATAESRFPEGVLFRLEAEGPGQVEEAVVRFRPVGGRITRYAPLELSEAGPRIAGEVFVRTDTADRYMPPGTELEFFFEVKDGEGNTLKTSPQRFTLLDPRRGPWREVRRGDLTALYYGPIRGRAEKVLEVAEATIKRMAPLLGLEEVRPLRFTLFNSWRDMAQALPPTSRVLRTALITEGTAFSSFGVILILANDPRVLGVTAHETTHFLVHQAMGGLAPLVPAWLNEGLAEYANPSAGSAYDAYLARALAQGTLLPITRLNAPPGRPDDIILFYGEARSLVRFMVDTYGKEKLALLFRALRQGKGIEQALEEVYGFGRWELENRWRESIGAPPLEPPREEAVPTPVPRPTVVPPGVAPPPSPTPAPAVPTPSPRGGGCTFTPRGDSFPLSPVLLGGGLVLLALLRPRRD